MRRVWHKWTILWTCMENMSTVLKPEEISFGVFFPANTASVTDVFEIIVQIWFDKSHFAWSLTIKSSYGLISLCSTNRCWPKSLESFRLELDNQILLSRPWSSLCSTNRCWPKSLESFCLELDNQVLLSPDHLLHVPHLVREWFLYPIVIQNSNSNSNIKNSKLNDSKKNLLLIDFPNSNNRNLLLIQFQNSKLKFKIKKTCCWLSFKIQN